jgi:RNA polymerase primary sigma factor
VNEESSLPDSIESVIAKARDAGQVPSEEMTRAIEDVELTPALIGNVLQRMQADNVALATDFEVEVEAEPLMASIRSKPDTALSSLATIDPIRAYLQSVSAVALLSAEQERELAEVMAVGQAAAEKLLEYSRMLEPPSTSDIAQLQAQRAAGLQARSRLVEANLRLVISIAKRYRHRGVSFLDLIQEGNAGLVKAIEKFDVSRGLRVSTYATWWIRQAIGRSIADQARTIRIPVHVYETLSRVLNVQRSLLQEYGREPSVEELAARVRMPEDKVRDILSIDRSTISFDGATGDDNGLDEVIGDQGAEHPDLAADRREMTEILRSAVANLSERERELMELRFGLLDQQPRTLEEVGQMFGVTRERIRQIEAKTLAKLRTPLSRRQIDEFLRD